MHKEYRQRLAKEYRYAVTKMQETQQPARKLFYFSVFFGEAQRVLNLEWNRDLALIYTVTLHAYTQIITQAPLAVSGQLPIDVKNVHEKLTQAAVDLAAYFEKPESESTRKELYQVLGCLAEIAYVVSGNGSYLYEKGLIKF